MAIGKLIVRVIKAEGLAAADMNGKSDPFVKMTLVNQYHRSSTQYRTLNPVWNEMFHFEIFDIHNQLDLWLYDEDRHGEDFLGRLCIPLLGIKHKKLLWYQLKDKKLVSQAKGKIQIRLDIEWSIVSAAIRTFTPLEELAQPPQPVIKRSLMMNNFNRAKVQIMILVDFLKYIKSCWQWENKLRSINAFGLFLLVTYYFELWMAPLFLLSLLGFNWLLIKSPKLRDLFGFDEHKYSIMHDTIHNNELICNDPFNEQNYGSGAGADDQNILAKNHLNNNNNNNYYHNKQSYDTNSISSSQSGSLCSSLKANCIILNSLNGLGGGGHNKDNNSDHSKLSSSVPGAAQIITPTQTNNNNSNQSNSNDNDKDEDGDNGPSLVERLSGAKDTLILVQDITGHIASYLERCSNALTFKVPFLSFLLMFCLSVATILLYLVPLRYIILIWGCNKFTKKLRNPNYIDNNELIDFLSRVPDNLQCQQQKNTISKSV